MNIPQVGSSVFDKIYSETRQGITTYSIPFPLESLLQKANEEGQTFSHSLFPFSRSLQRPIDLRYDPLLNPRLVLGVSSGSLGNSKLFLGYVKATDQMEVISYNDEAGRFEFQLVRNYSRDPKVSYVNRAKCISCHQGQAPIFSTGPWADSSLGIIGDLLNAKLGLSQNNLSEMQLVFAKLFGAKSSVPNISMLDSLVRDANQIALDERIWLIGCGKNRECRLGLLLKTLAPSYSGTKKYILQSEAELSKSALKKQGQYHSFLSSFDLGTREVALRQSGSGPLDLPGLANSPAGILQIINNIYRLSPEDNPATKRFASLEGTNLVGNRLSTFSLEDMNDLYEEGRNANQVGEAIQTLYLKESPIFEEGPINKLYVMQELLKQLSSPSAEKYSFWLKKKTPERVLLSEPIIPVFQKAELNIFTRHCASCHASGFQYPPQFLEGSENQVIEKINGLRDRIRYKLENALMPPDPSKRLLMEQTGDKEILLKYLSQLR